jgi:hypothetical protein
VVRITQLKDTVILTNTVTTVANSNIAVGHWLTNGNSILKLQRGDRYLNGLRNISLRLEVIVVKSVVVERITERKYH